METCRRPCLQSLIVCLLKHSQSQLKICGGYFSCQFPFCSFFVPQSEKQQQVKASLKTGQMKQWNLSTSLRLLQHIPFRESKLTHYLQGFFCGRGKACMIVNINQCASMYDETLNVLKFSAVAQKVIFRYRFKWFTIASDFKTDSKQSYFRLWFCPRGPFSSDL